MDDDEGAAGIMASTRSVVESLQRLGASRLLDMLILDLVYAETEKIVTESDSLEECTDWLNSVNDQLIQLFGVSDSGGEGSAIWIHS